jgi:hypothetical protein
MRNLVANLWDLFMFWLDRRYSSASVTAVQLCKALRLTAHHTVPPYSSSNSLLFAIGINVICDPIFSQ